MNISFDIDRLYEIIACFYTLTKIRIAIYDDNFNPIISVPETDCKFCTELKKNTALKKRCAECDLKAKEACLVSGNLHIYTCHAGLIEAIAPLKMNGIVLGYVMLGQIAEKSQKEKNKKTVLQYVGNHTGTDMSEDYDHLTTKNKKQIEAAASIMEACACYLWANRLVKVNEDCLAALISNYISSNLTADLSVDTLCEHFGISRNKLYKISNNGFGMSIAAYIRKQRVLHAAALLQSGSTVADAAIAAGFNDYNYFSKIFKTQMGILPGKYKRLQNNYIPSPT